MRPNTDLFVARTEDAPLPTDLERSIKEYEKAVSEAFSTLREALSALNDRLKGAEK